VSTSSHALELLRLLAEDAPTAEVEARAQLLVGDEPGDGESARKLAARVKTLLDSRKRREGELGALVETAHDLASMGDPSGVLDAIVRRARSLLGTDTAYLTLYDPEVGDTMVRATAGSVSATFQSLRLPLGAGIGGLVAETHRPYWTADYQNDRRFGHTGEIDSAVGEEGLVAICGTPLLVDHEFVGVLFASNRVRRPFSADEVALLGSLASLAAVSLVQTRALAETRASSASVSKAAEAHDRFAAVVLEGGGVQDVTAVLNDLLGGWVVVLDAEGRRTAAHGAAPPGGPSGESDPLAEHPVARASAASGRLAEGDGVAAVVATASGELLGTLVLGTAAELDAGEQRMVERAAVVAALVLLFRRQAAEAQQRVRTDLLSDLLAHDGSLGAEQVSLAERARLLGISLDDEHVVAVCQTRPEQVRSLALSASSLLANMVGAGSGAQGAGPAGGGLVGVHHGDVVLLVPAGAPLAEAGPSRAAAELARRLGRGDDVTVGAAGPVVPHAGLAAAWSEARRTCQALRALGAAGKGAAAVDLGFAGLVVGDRPDINGYLRAQLGAVLDYDQQRGTDLVSTLQAYFRSGCSPRHAASTLHVHVNTVTQRLDRVRALIGEDWQSPERLLELQLAMRLRQVLGGSTTT